MTPHFFVRPEAVTEDCALLDDSDTRHLVVVLRAQVGDAVSVSDGAGTVWNGAYAGRRDGKAQITVRDRRRVPRTVPSVTVVHALPRQRKLDEVVQRLTELGVDRVVPVHSERSQVRLDGRRADKALQRWRAVALAAAKQSRRAFLPVVDEIGDWSTAFATATSGVVCWEESHVPLRSALEAAGAGDPFVVAVGPEGGLSAGEVDATGLPHGSLGATVLRTETAAVVAVSAVRYHLGLMAP